MLASSQTIAPKPATLPPAAQPALPASGSAGGPSFAQFLNDQPVALTPPPEHADPVPREPESAGNETKAAAPAPAPARRPATPAKQGPSQAADSSAKAESKAAAKSEDAGDGDIAATDEAQDPETSGLDEFTQLIGLTPQALTAQAVPGGLTASEPGAEAAEGEAPAARHGRSRINQLGDDGATPAAARGGADTTATVAGDPRRPTEGPARDVAPRAKGVDLAAAADKAAARIAASSESLQTATAAAGNAGTTPQAAASSATPPASFAAVLAQAMPITAAAADTAPVSASGQVHAAVHSNAFAPELSARVSLLAVDGVQQAELQLNPADMGPVSVQIVVDGAQAQVSFHAVQAETRQALEQSLPDLAAALQSQGLTLSGGGVFQQARQDAKGGDAEADSGTDSRSSRTNTGGGRVTAGATAVPARRSVGLLDTFA